MRSSNLTEFKVFSYFARTSHLELLSEFFVFAKKFFVKHGHEPGIF